MDIITGSYKSAVDWCLYMDPATWAFVFKAGLILLMPAAFAQAAIAQGNTSSIGQSIAVLAGVLLAAAWPIPDLDHLPQVKFWIFSFCALVIASLPVVLPKGVVKGLNIQKKAVLILYGIFLLLFLLQLFGGRY